MRSRCYGSWVTGFALVLSACNGAETLAPSDGVVPVKVQTVAEAAGENCPNGGTLIQVGYDQDGDDALSEGEVSSQSYVCSGADAPAANGSKGADGHDGADGTDGTDGTDGAHGTPGSDGKDGANGLNGSDGEDGQNGLNGSDGTTSLVRTDFESPGLNCLHGGIEIQFGPDVDRSGALEDAEVTTTNYVCNGAAGLNGGADGLSSLVRTTVEAPGLHCGAGGTRVEMGIDDNQSTVLDPSEVDSVSFVCAGVSGALSLVGTLIELPGAHCAAGGTRVTSGVDDDGDELLDGDEVDQTIYVCNGLKGLDGLNGADGLITLARTTLELGGVHCLVGGLKLETGLDSNKNGALGDAEVLATNYVCNGQKGIDGVNGLLSLVRTGVELVGAHCSLGGLKLESGLDKNGNGVLSDAEVLATNYVCNGKDGLDGLNGLNGLNGFASLVRTSIELGGAHCLVGGLKLESGLDANANGVLSDAEVLATSYICNGKNGLNGLNGLNGVDGLDGLDGLASLVRIKVELAGSHCLVGGLKLETGMDANRNGVLNDGEVIATDYVCSGKDGLNGLDGLDGVNGSDGVNGLASLVRTSVELRGSHCLVGGLKLETGLDANKNGMLNDAEVLATNYVCHGEDGLDGLNGASGQNGLNGLSTLVKQALELPGSNCVTGGLKLDTGVDANKNGLLDASEVTKTDYICNGLNGLNGLNGTNGTSGANSLIKTVIEPIGPNCHVSGLKVNSGPDTNGNGVLDNGEITGVSYLCL